MANVINRGRVTFCSEMWFTLGGKISRSVTHVDSFALLDAIVAIVIDIEFRLDIFALVTYLSGASTWKTEVLFSCLDCGIITLELM